MESIETEGQQPKLGKEPLSDELVSIMESAPGKDDAALSKKRSSDKLEYKKLYNETYGNVPSSSSDDEDWSGTIAPRKRKKSTAEASSAPENGNASSSRRVSISDALKLNPEETEHKPRRKLNVKDTDLSPAELKGGTPATGSTGKRAGSSTHRRLGETKKQRLYESFKENQYPGRATKERLCKELGMTFQQVSKWFENTRWSFNNPSSNQETAAKRV
ncbi:hypothetical protein like AT3G19510 [Hibiscus trionum]|uniref:Homeobox domain-containing protein n=1 Tax=Hibiscus trionum TaxID=183268 RepID=A0A9W7JGH8_HIBTR|nr:hypothetical protein like AT3G19510 [Hibiscus trionum]